jgi:hypothetical protein
MIFLKLESLSKVTPGASVLIENFALKFLIRKCLPFIDLTTFFKTAIWPPNVCDICPASCVYLGRRSQRFIGLSLAEQIARLEEAAPTGVLPVLQRCSLLLMNSC